MTPDWAVLVAAVERGDRAGEEELCRTLERGARWFLRRCGFYDCDDLVQDVVLAVLEAIWKGWVEQPAMLGSYFRTILRRRCAAAIAENVAWRERQADDADVFEVRDGRLDPEELVYQREKEDLMRRMLLGMPERQREVLTRFYLDGHTAERIQADMELSDTQFRLMKSRAKARFGELGRERLKNKFREDVKIERPRQYTRADLFARL